MNAHARLAVALAGMLAGHATAGAVVGVLRVRFTRPAVFWAGMRLVLTRIVLVHPPPVTGTIGPASERTALLNTARRAQYVIAAARRVATAMTAARSRGGDPVAAGQQAADAEQRYYAQHLAAMWQRATAAGHADLQAASTGPLLGWYAHRDDRTTPECAAADGGNFQLTRPPAIGYPGTVHARCRCWPGPPHPGGRLLPARP